MLFGRKKDFAKSAQNRYSNNDLENNWRNILSHCHLELYDFCINYMYSVPRGQDFLPTKIFAKYCFNLCFQLLQNVT